MRLVIQTNGHNCGSACLAMLLGLDSVEAAEKLLERRVGELRDPGAEDPTSDDAVIGLSVQEVTSVLWRLHVRHLHVVVPGTGDADVSWFTRCAPAMPALPGGGEIERHLRDGGAALLAVPSRKNEGGQHWIVAEGMALFDPTPNRKQAYTAISPEAPLTVFEAVLIAGQLPVGLESELAA